MKLPDFFPNIHREGYIFILTGLAFTLLVSSTLSHVGWISAIITVWIIYFFRDPERVTPKANDLVISPADGVIQKIESALPPEELKLEQKEWQRISIFLNIFNVHVNRVPTSGKIKKVVYTAGQFLNASLDKASELNERQTCLLETKNKDNIIFAQIAGLIAKRIVCDLKSGQEVISGDRFGIIRFGSRMDIYLPSNYNITALEGQTTIAGETILANLATKSIQPKSAQTNKETRAAKTKKTVKTKASSNNKNKEKTAQKDGSK